MSNNYFQFKQFKINQSNCAMKVGTDGVLLGAWTDVENVKSILDIGTGTGLIALMLAQRSNALINAIEIDKDAYIQAKDNIENSNWNDRIKIQNVSLQDFVTDEKFDLIVCNPPYFQNSLKNPDEKKTIARHTVTLTFDELIDYSVKILSPLGRLVVIIPFSEIDSFMKKAENQKLSLNKILNVKPNATKEIKRVICEFEFIKKPFSESYLTIEKGSRHEYSDEYISLTKDFYLKF